MEINWLEILIGDTIFAIILAALFVYVETRNTKKGEETIEKMLNAKVDVLQQEFIMIQNEVRNARDMILESGKHG